MSPRHSLRRVHLALGALVVGGALALAGCGGDPDVGDVQDKLAEDVPEQAQAQAQGVEFDGDSVSCPEGQSVAEGETFECTIDAVEQSQDVVYTISVEMTGENSFTWRLSDVEPAGGGGTDTE